MKGAFIHNQLEFRLEVAGADYCQGDSLSCNLSVKNHAAAAQAIPGVRLDLADTNLKKLKDKKEDALKVISSAALTFPPEIGPQGQGSVAWTFDLDRNCTISDKGQSLFFVYGGVAEDACTGQLPLVVYPHRHIQKVVSLFESLFQFVPKGQKSSNGQVQVKMKPPTDRKLSFVEELVLGLSFEKDALRLEYIFKVKAFDTTSTSGNVKKIKTDVSQTFEPEQYILSGEHLNHDFLEVRINEALAVVATGI